MDHERPQQTWTNAVFASLRPSDHHVSDEEIFEILNAGSDGETTADLRAAKHITVPMYCVWKAKYRQMSLEELRRARGRERWRARGVLVVLLAVAVLGAGGIVIGLARTAQANITVTAEPAAPDARIAPPVVASSPQPLSAPPEPTPPVVVSTPSAPMPEAAAPSAPPPAVDQPGYKIQVAAANSLQEGRALVARLASAGYPAYLFQTTIGDVEVFRVRVGPFDALPAAEEVASRLHREGYKGAWIAR